MSLLSTALIAAVASLFSLGFYRLFLSPLARIPGPKVAALTSFYEFYWDCLQPGQFTFQTDRLHKKYGPIIRIGPNEVHINDPEYYGELTAQKHRLDKDPRFYRFLGSTESAFSTPGYELHRKRRTKENPFFSRATVDRQEPVVARSVQTLCDRLVKSVGEIVDIHCAFRSLSADIVTEYCFKESFNFLDAPDYSKNYHSASEGFAAAINWMRHIKYLANILLSLPEKWVSTPETEGIFKFRNHISRQVRKLMVTAGDEKQSEGKVYSTIIQQLMHSDLDLSDKTEWSLSEKAFTIVAAAEVTTARVMEVTLFNVLNDPDALSKLQQELKEAYPDASTLLTHRELERLPYLTACLMESQRMSPAVAGRSPRINRNADMIYKDYVIPKNTVISMTIRQQHWNEEIFPDPMKFKPERWLGESKKQLQKYFIPFAKGSRSCVGMILAWAELYVSIGNIFRRFDLELYDTTPDDVAVVRDNFSPKANPGSHGVWIKVKGVESS